jgi:hypothetical protein
LEVVVGGCRAATQLVIGAAPALVWAASNSVTAGADTVANRPSFFNSVRRCLALLDFDALAGELSLLPVLAISSPRYVYRYV